VQRPEVAIKLNVNDNDCDMWIDGAMHHSFSGNFSRDVVFNRHYLLIYVYEGRGCLINARNEVETISEGSLLLFRPKERQCFWGDEDNPLRFFGIVFYGRLFDKLLSKNSFMASTHSRISLNKNLISSMNSFLDLLASRQNSNDILLYSNLFSILALCKVELENVSKNTVIKLAKDPLEKVIEYMMENYAKHITISDIANQVGYSVTWVEENFKRKYYMSPIKYLANIRINRAKQLLYEDRYNVSEICYAIGYDNPLYFSKAFKKLTGISPKNYKISCKNFQC
jgi:AraC family transcriptional regulator of arabinose operon